MGERLCCRKDVNVCFAFGVCVAAQQRTSLREESCYGSCGRLQIGSSDGILAGAIPEHRSILAVCFPDRAGGIAVTAVVNLTRASCWP